MKNSTYNRNYVIDQKKIMQLSKYKSQVFYLLFRTLILYIQCKYESVAFKSSQRWQSRIRYLQQKILQFLLSHQTSCSKSSVLELFFSIINCDFILFLCKHYYLIMNTCCMMIQFLNIYNFYQMSQKQQSEILAILQTKEVKLNKLAKLFGLAQSKKQTNKKKMPDKITEHLYIGCFSAATNFQYLQSEKIKAIVMCMGYQNFQFRQQIQYLQLKIYDYQQENIRKYFEQSHRFIEQRVARNQKILIHCFKGISRSATIIIAYLMKKNQIKFQEAFNIVIQKRNIINPNIGFIKQLQKYQQQLQIERNSKQKQQVKSSNNQQQKIDNLVQQYTEIKQRNNQELPKIQNKIKDQSKQQFIIIQQSIQSKLIQSQIQKQQQSIIIPAAQNQQNKINVKLETLQNSELLNKQELVTQQKTNQIINNTDSHQEILQIKLEEIILPNKIDIAPNKIQVNQRNAIEVKKVEQKEAQNTVKQNNKILIVQSNKVTQQEAVKQIIDDQIYIEPITAVETIKKKKKKKKKN